MPKVTNITEKIYDSITGEGEARACDAIAETACVEAPGNFTKNAINGFCTKFAEQLTSPGVVIPWVFSLLNVSIGVTGLLVPMKNIGSLLPQLLVSAKIRGYAIRKYFWTLAGLVQGVMLLLMALSIYKSEADTAGLIIVSCLFIYSMASGVGSIAFKDVLGKTIPKGKRGKLLATRATGGGILTILSGIYFYFFLLGNDDRTTYALLFVVAAVLWFIAALLFATITEEKGAQEGGRTPISEFKKGSFLLKDDINFRNFLIVRALLIAIPVAQPFFIMHASEMFGVNLQGLGLFVLIVGISNALSSPFWGKSADKSKKLQMAIAALIGIMTLFYASVFEKLPDTVQNIYVYSPIFFLIIMAHAGARLGRKTYLVDYAPKAERPLYVSVANTLIGIVALVTAGVGFIAQVFSIYVLFYFLISLLIIALVMIPLLKRT